ncbi:ThiF family adenylyltransferase [Thermodesulfobacteriota bacterium]
MREGLIEKVAEAAAPKERPDGSTYRSLSFADQRRLADSHGSDHKAVQLAALQQGIVPEVYARNQKRLSSEDQIKLLQSHVAVIGLGGLGGTVTEILARIGIGRLTLVDGDHFDDSNLNRQLLSSTEVLGEQKAAVAAKRVKAVNPAVKTQAVSSFLTAENAETLLSGATIAVDCLDSITDRFTLETACRTMAITMVSAAIGGSSGQLTVIYPGDTGLSRIYGSPEKAADRGIEKTMGTLPFAAIAMAAMECAEVVAMAVGDPSGLRNKLLITDLVDHSLDIVELD